MAARYAKLTGDVAIAILYDVTKAFDNISFDMLFACARRIAFPTAFLAFLVDIYMARRYVVIDNVVAASVCPNRFVLAGCSFADIMMFLLMMTVDLHVAQAAPTVHRGVVADDYQILVTHPLKEAVRCTVEAHAAATSAFMDLKLPVSAKKLALTLRLSVKA